MLRLLFAICISAGLMACQVAQAQQNAATAIHALYTSGQYNEYLQHLDQTLGKLTPETQHVSLPIIVSVAIALDKTNQWDSPVAADAQSMLAACPDAARYFLAAKRLLLNDISGASLFFEGNPPDYSLWRSQIPELRRQGYALAADVFSALYMTGSTGLGTPQESRVINDGVESLAALGEEQREAVEEVLVKQLEDGDNWYGQRCIAQTAMHLCRQNKANADTYFDISTRFDDGSTPYSVEDARAISRSGNRELAIRVAEKASEANPGNIEQQREVGRFLSQVADRGTTISFYGRTLATAPKPQVRELRFQYLQWLSESQDEAELSKSLQQLGPLGIADERMARGSFEQAGQAYGGIVANGDLSLEDRLDALVGWLRVKPEEALERAAGVAAELKNARQSDPKFADTVKWLGWQVWKTSRPVPPGSMDADPNQHDAIGAVMTDDQKRIAASAADIIEMIIEADPVACLRDDSRAARSLRIPAATLLALSQRPDKAAQALSRSITYEVAPPPGGWRNPPGARAPQDAHVPRIRTSPTAGELISWKKEVVTLLGNSGASKEVIAATERAFYADKEF